MKEASDIIVTNETQLDIMKDAKTLRLARVKTRKGAETLKNDLKKDSLKYGKAVQSMYNLFLIQSEAVEKHLKNQEDFIKIKEQKAIDDLREKRTIDIKGFEDFIPQFSIDLGAMSDDDFKMLLDGAKASKKQQADNEEKERKEQEQLKADNEKLIEENKKLAAHQKETDELLKKEQFEADEKQRVIDEENAQIEADKLKLDNAPDKEKLLELAKLIDSIEMPVASTTEGQDIINNTKVLIQKTSAYVRANANKL